MRTIMGFSGGLDSTYVLWKLLKETDDEVTVIHINYDHLLHALESSRFSKYKLKAYDDPCTKEIELIKKRKLLNIIDWMQKNIRTFVYKEIDLDEKYLNKDIPNSPDSFIAFYAVENINNNIFDKVVFPMEMENDGSSHSFSINASTMASKIFHNMAKRGTIGFPLLDTNYHQGYSIKELPEELFKMTRSCNHIDAEGNDCNQCFKCRKRFYFKKQLDNGKTLQEIRDMTLKESFVGDKWISMKAWLMKHDEVYKKYRYYDNEEVDLSFFEKHEMIKDLPTWPQSFSKD